MAIIKCPECGKDVSDKSDKCIHCGFPLDNFESVETIIDEKLLRPHTYCPKCNYVNPMGVWICESCGHKYKDKEYEVIYPNKPSFRGVYRYDFWGNEEEVHCPNCKSENCSPYQEQRTIPGKTKTSYSVNLNPFKPFTLANKKEKVVRQEKTITIQKFICNRCGKIFD